MMHGYGFNMMGNNIYGWIIFLILSFLIGFAIYNLLSTNNNHKKGPNNQALSILKEKLAEGEITEAEYMRKKKMLNSK